MTGTLDLPHDPEQERILPAEKLQEFLVNLFIKKGMYAAEAKIGAERLIEADLRGIHSHGSRAVGRYLKGFDEGHIDPRGTVLPIKETAAIAVLDGGRALGQVSATKAMNLAIEKAKEVGTGTVALKHGHHFGAASVYVLLAIEAGVIGFCTTSTYRPTVAAFGSRQAANANNALAWGVPVLHGAPFVLDMACAEAAWGKLDTSKRYGLPIPKNWALDENGHPTTDPAAAKTLLPFSGARGYGLGLVCSLLAGPLAGAKMSIHKSDSAEADGSEHFFQAIDLEMFGVKDSFLEEFQQTIEEIHQLEPQEGFDKVRIPGELEWERFSNWKDNGIPLHHSHVEQLEELARTHSVEIPWSM